MMSETETQLENLEPPIVENQIWACVGGEMPDLKKRDFRVCGRGL